MTWIDVADTATKIGLGALIAGIFALIAAIVNHRHQLILSRDERLRVTLEEISKELEAVLSKLFLQGMHDARNAEDQLGVGYDEEIWWKKFLKYQAKVDDAIAIIHVLNGRLRLFACEASANLLDSISDLLVELPDKIGPMKEYGNASLDTVLSNAFKEISEKKALFYKELNKEAIRVIR